MMDFALAPGAAHGGPCCGRGGFSVGRGPRVVDAIVNKQRFKRQLMATRLRLARFSRHDRDRSTRGRGAGRNRKSAKLRRRNRYPVQQMGNMLRSVYIRMKIGVLSPTFSVQVRVRVLGPPPRVLPPTPTHPPRTPAPSPYRFPRNHQFGLHSSSASTSCLSCRPVVSKGSTDAPASPSALSPNIKASAGAWFPPPPTSATATKGDTIPPILANLHEKKRMNHHR